VAGLLDKRLVFVSGKGGVGKSTVAAALGLVAARRGLWTMVAEVSGQDRVVREFGREPRSFSEIELTENLYGFSIEPREALEEYLRDQLPSKRLADVVGGSRMFQYLAAATPGLSELATIGKLWELAQLERRTRGAGAYDLVVVDAPATGHGVAIMHTPKTFSDIARVGPIARQAGKIHAFISDPELTGVVSVSLPEEMAVNEAIVIHDELADGFGLELDLSVLNQMLPDRFSDEEAPRLERAGAELDGFARFAVAVARAEHERGIQEREQRARLVEGTGLEPVELPLLPQRELGRDGIGKLADHLEASL
jgi:anion-transporting  ArsA/GET3 family ATPase